LTCSSSIQDADDFWHPEKLARQAARFAARPELEISITHQSTFWEPELDDRRRAMQGHALTKEVLPGYVLQTMLARRRALAKVGEFNPELRFGEDTDWFIRAQDAGVPLELLPDVLVTRRFHKNNLTWQREADGLHNNLLDMIQHSLKRRRRNASDTNTVQPESQDDERTTR